MKHEALDRMSGKTYLYKANLYKVLSYNIDNGKTTVVTDSRWLVFDTKDINGELKDFLPVDDTFNEHGLIVSRQKDMSGITNTLLNTLSEIQAGKADMGKIKAINSTVNTILNVFKTELQISSLKNKNK